MSKTVIKADQFKDKPLLINFIINSLREENAKRNAILVKQNLFLEQKPFDADGTFLSLVFMPENEIKKIASLIVKP